MTEWVVTREVSNERGVAREVKPRGEDFPIYFVEIRFVELGGGFLLVKEVQEEPGWARHIEVMPPFLLEHIAAMSMKMLGVLKSPKQLTHSMAFKEGSVSETDDRPSDDALNPPMLTVDPDYPGGLEPQDYALQADPSAILTLLTGRAPLPACCGSCRHWAVSGLNQQGVSLGLCGLSRSHYSRGLTTEQESCDGFATLSRVEDADGSDP